MAVKPPDAPAGLDVGLGAGTSAADDPAEGTGGRAPVEDAGAGIAGRDALEGPDDAGAGIGERAEEAAPEEVAGAGIGGRAAATAGVSGAGLAAGVASAAGAAPPALPGVATMKVSVTPGGRTTR